VDPVQVEPQAILQRLIERLPQFLVDPRMSQLLAEVAMRDAAIEQLRAKVAELEGQIASTNGSKHVDMEKVT
jgi:hypothetical protein